MPLPGSARTNALLLSLVLGLLPLACADDPAAPADAATNARVDAAADVGVSPLDATRPDAADVGVTPLDATTPDAADVGVTPLDATTPDADVGAPPLDASTPDAGGCPAEAPAPAGACAAVAEGCTYGQECCCGKCFPSLVCSCDPTGTWLCFYTDACFGPCEGEDAGATD